jgi:hypothetical protein
MAAAKKSYVVTAELALFTTGTHTGPMKLYYYKGSPVPEDAPQSEIDHHLAVGLIATTGEAEKELSAQPDEVPSATGSTTPAKPAAK